MPSIPSDAGRATALLAGAVTAAGSVFPWATATATAGDRVTTYGLRTDGLLTLAAAVVVVMTVLIRSRIVHLVGLAGALYIVATAIPDAADPARFASRPDGIDIEVSVAYGLWIVVCAGLLLAAVHLVLIASRP